MVGIFKDHQVYTFGDDVRFIDWKLLAKTSTPYIKTYEEERNVEIVVVVDLTASMFYGYAGVSKLQAAIEICCLLLLLAKETKDLVHMILIGEEVVDLPACAGERGIVQLVESLHRRGMINAEGQTSCQYVPKKNVPEKFIMQTLLKFLARRKEVVVLSDFWDFLSFKELKNLFYKGQFHCFQILSPVDELLLGKSKGMTNFSILGRSTTGEGIRGGPLKGRGIRDSQNLLGKHLKTLWVQERYLEQFIKEMM